MPISIHDAVKVTFRYYVCGQSIMVHELEDLLWLARADAARKEGYASDEEVAEFLSVGRNSADETQNDDEGD